MTRRTIVSLLALATIALAAPAVAQTTIPPPANPLVYCVNQPAPPADSWELVFDGGAPEPIAMTPATTAGPATTFCEANAPVFTHSFTLPASRFPPRQAPYVAIVRALNAFGLTVGVPHSVSIGIAPGQPSVTAVGQLPSGTPVAPTRRK
jgi:hypothetical protein